MVDVIVLKPGESVVIDTTANIVEVANVWAVPIAVEKNGEIVAMLVEDIELYTLGYNAGAFVLRNTGEYDAKIYVFRSFIF